MDINDFRDYLRTPEGMQAFLTTGSIVLASFIGYVGYQAKQTIYDIRTQNKTQRGKATRILEHYISSSLSEDGESLIKAYNELRIAALSGSKEVRQEATILLDQVKQRLEPIIRKELSDSVAAINLNTNSDLLSRLSGTYSETFRKQI